MNSKELEHKYQYGLTLWNEGNLDEGAEIWSNLAKLGHIASIARIAQVFLEQYEFEIAESYLIFTNEQSDAQILSLQTRIAKERETERTRILKASVRQDSGRKFDG